MPGKTSSPIRWAPKVKQDKIRRLYESDAQGMRDEDLLNDVALDLYLRCVSILEVTDAVNGLVKCHACGGTISHQREDRLTCSACGWEVAWKIYQQSYRGMQLFGGAALPFFQVYAAGFDLKKSYCEKILAVDFLIHQFHWYHKANQQLPEAGRPAAANLIEGKGMRKVLEFLDGLTYGTRMLTERSESQNMGHSLV